MEEVSTLTRMIRKKIHSTLKSFVSPMFFQINDLVNVPNPPRAFQKIVLIAANAARFLKCV